MIPTYNCADLLAATLQSVLDQDPGPDVMQIEVVDDRSTADDPGEVVADLGRGRVELFRQPDNVGISRNFTTCVWRARGDLVHVLHGDDLAYPGLYAAVDDAFAARPEAGAVLVGSEDIDEHGTYLSPNHSLAEQPGILRDRVGEFFAWNDLRAPGIVIRRSVYEQVGGYRDGLRHCADWDMWRRVAVAAPLFWQPEVLVGYRVHSRSDTSRLAFSPAQLREMVDTVRIGHEYLPLGQTRAWTRTFYGRARRFAWSQLRAGATGDARVRYAGLVAECVARQQWDRLVSAPRRRGW